MTQIVNPSIDRVADSFLTAGSLAYAGLRDGGIVPSGEVTELAKQSAIDETVLDGFSFSTSSSSLDVTISPGEAFVFGSWLAKDTTTTVTLPPSSFINGIILTWDKDSPNTVQIGLLRDFDELPDPDEFLIITGGFPTDGDGVTGAFDAREFVSIDAERLDGNETSEIKPNISDSGSTVVENADDINVEGGISASDDGDGSATIVGEAQYTDTDAINAVDSESSLSVNISGDANSVDGFSFVKNGNSGPGIINYKTGIEASGGTTIIDRTISGVDYRIHAFESVGSSTFSVNQAPSGATVDVLVVAGGGGGGGGFDAGGGGAGGIVTRTDLAVDTVDYTIEVGRGGELTKDSNGKGENGKDSNAFGLNAIGGGGGASHDGFSSNAGTGGSGGGGARGSSNSSLQGLQPTSTDGGFGEDGGSGGFNNGGGGGGATQAGDSRDNNDPNGGGNGGDGIDVSGTFGTSFGENGVFGGGGGGGAGSNQGVGGLGGGGDGNKDSTSGIAGTPNTGGGCGGNTTGGNNPSGGVYGGSGIVLIRYEI